MYREGLEALCSVVCSVEQFPLPEHIILLLCDSKPGDNPKLIEAKVQKLQGGGRLLAPPHCGLLCGCESQKLGVYCGAWW